MIPLITPKNHQVLNLLQMVSLKEGAPGTKDAGKIMLTMTNGDVFEYEDQAAEFVNREVKFAIGVYRAWQTQLGTEPPVIVTPSGETPPNRFNM